MSDSPNLSRPNRLSEGRGAASREGQQRRMSLTSDQGILYFPQHLIPKDKQYMWARHSCVGQPDQGNMTMNQMNDWTPVPASRHPEIQLPAIPGFEERSDAVIIRGANILMEKPKEWYDADKKLLEKKNIDQRRSVNEYVVGGTVATPRFVESNEVTFEQGK